MRILKAPSAVGVALRLDEGDRLRDSIVRNDVGGAQVVETAQNVVVVTGREREAGEGRVDDLAVVEAARLSERRADPEDIRVPGRQRRGIPREDHESSYSYDARHR